MARFDNQGEENVMGITRAINSHNKLIQGWFALVSQLNHYEVWWYKASITDKANLILIVSG